MKLILILTFFCTSSILSQPLALASSNEKSSKMTRPPKLTTTATNNTARCIDDPKNPQLKCSKKIPGKKVQTPTMPKLKPHQYALSMNNKYKVIDTKIFEGLLLTQNCFKGQNPSCEAYNKSIKKVAGNPQDHMKSPFHNNIGAIHCELMGGRGMIARTPEGDQSDFCLFKDGSMVSSWSAYYKTNPPTQTK